MKEKSKVKQRLFVIGIIVIMIMALLIPFVFASQNKLNIQEKQFFSVDSNTKTAGSMLEMAINLECIDYDEFIFTLTDENNLSNVNTDTIQEDVEIEKENNTIVITGNKLNMNMQEIKLYYKIPENLEVGTQLTFKAEIEKNSEKEQSDSDMQVNEILDTNVTIGDEAGNVQNDKQTIEIIVTIFEEEQDDSNKEEQNLTRPDTTTQGQASQEQMSQNQSEKQGNLSNERQQSGESISGLSASMVDNIKSTTSMNSNSQVESVTYNGSSNNYLKALIVEGHNLNSNFIKENSTYFVTTTDDITSLNITATAEDENATVAIYGNDEIKEGSKILISVTAENGDVRMYRIYITR